MDDYRRDCFFFPDLDNVADVEVVTCQYDRHPGYCPCQGCGLYISKEDARCVVQNFVDKQIESED